MIHAHFQKLLKGMAIVLISCSSLIDIAKADEVVTTTTTCQSGCAVRGICTQCTKTTKKEGLIGMILKTPSIVWDSIR